MSRTHIPAVLRERVRLRAQRLCEYCLLSEDDGMHAFQVDHVISEKHEGPTEEHNLAFCCPFCNRAKGSDIAGRVNGELVRLFNLRIDRWSEHFSLEGVVFVALTKVGIATIQLLSLNDSHRLALRQELKNAGRFPSGTHPLQ